MSNSEETRKARRKRQDNSTCRFDNDEVRYPVYEFSAHGFSFLCPKNSCPFKRGVMLDRIAIANAEDVEIISASGTVVHVTELDFLNMRIGVLYAKKTLDRTMTGKIRVPRHVPKVRLDALLSVAHDSGERQLSGSVVDFTASTARIGFDEGLPVEVQVGDEVTIAINADNKVLFDGQADIVRKRNDGAEIIISFSDRLLDVSHIETVSDALQNRMVVSSALEPLKNFDAVSEKYKALISDWRMYMYRLKRVLDQEESKGLYRLPSEQELFLQGIEEKIFADMRNYVFRLNSIADNITENESIAYKEYFRENLRPVYRASPLISSIIDKDFGYAGDFETIKYFFQNPYSGDSLLGKLINKFICSMEAVTAHQDRIRFLHDELSSLNRNAEKGFSFLSLGSGPAEEVLRFVEENTFEKPVQAALVDMDAFALADFSEQFQYLPKENFTVDLININLLNIIKKKESSPVKGKYDFTYCAGLFDYFDQGICKRFVRYLINRTLPGGAVIITNVHKNNFSQHFMDYGGGWEIIHRDEKEMAALVPPEYRTELYSDEKHTNIYLKIHISDVE